jgi:heme/copper-type cytochrome/quinol oxidase subunit 2
MGIDSINDSSSELIFTLFMMGVLLIFCVVAVVIFFRLWRKENKGHPRRDFFK